MASRKVLRALYGLLSVPYFVASWCLRYLELFGIKADFQRCLHTVDETQPRFPSPLLGALCVAEDHRNEFHFGIDHIGMARAAVAILVSNHIEGASTIEQQFVRTITGRYERTFWRKLREQVLAVSLCLARPKHEIMSAYLANAYYGVGLTGSEGLTKILFQYGSDLSLEMAVHAVSHLKYPRPEPVTNAWSEVINQRKRFLIAKCSQRHNKAMLRRATSVFPIS